MIPFADPYGIEKGELRVDGGIEAPALWLSIPAVVATTSRVAERQVKEDFEWEMLEGASPVTPRGVTNAKRLSHKPTSRDYDSSPERDKRGSINRRSPFALN